MKDSYREDFERRWGERVAVADSPGFVRTEVLRPVKGNYYVVVTHWQTMRDFENWTNSGAFRESHVNTHPGKPSRVPARWRFTK